MQKKKKAQKTKLRTLLLSVITVALAASIATFVGVGASGLDGNNVSDSDNGGLLSLSETNCNIQINNCQEGDYMGFYVADVKPYPVYIDWGDGEKVLVDEECYEPDEYKTWCEGTVKGSTVKIYTESNEVGIQVDGGSHDLSNSKGLDIFASNYGEKIGDLNLSGCTALWQIVCEDCLIESIDLTGSSEVSCLMLTNPELSELDVSELTGLMTLDIHRRRLDSEVGLKELDLSNNKILTTLDCSYHDIEELDLSNNTNLSDIIICGNKIKFSKLTLFDGWESCRVKELSGQTYVYDKSEVSAGSTIDLSSEYSVGGNTTQYKWYAADELNDEDAVEVTPAKSENGKFTFGDSVVGKYVYCVMTNDTFPDMDVTTTPIKITQNIACKHSKTKLVNKKAATCSEEGYTGDKVCTSCGEVVTPGTSIEKIAHTFKKYVSNNDATCMSDGTKTAKCTKCDATNTITDFGTKLPHTYGACSYLDEETHRHTCTVEGCGYEEVLSHRGGTATYTEQAVCMDCGGSYGELVPHDIKLNIDAITLLKDKTFETIAYKYPSNSTKTITWTSSNEAVATVDQNGKITAVAKGKADITAVIEGGSSAQIKVTVIDSWKKETQSITVNKPTYTLTIKRNKLNPTVSLSAKIKGNSTGKMWYSDDINVATVNKRGKVTAVGAGTTEIHCRTADGEIVASSVITVNEFRIDSDNMCSNNIIYVEAGDTCKLDLTNTTADSSAVTWKSSNAKYASIDQNGNVTALKKGTVTITVTTADKSKDTCKLIVVDPTNGLKMNKTSASIYVGKSVSLKASLVTRGSNDPVFWTSSNSSIASVSSKGVVKGLKQGTVTITATSFSGQKTTATITVRTKATVLEFTKTTPALYMDGHVGVFTVKIASPVNSNDTITWSTSNKKVIAITDISDDGKTITVKSGKKGTATITAKAGSGKKVTYKVTSVNVAAESMTLNNTSASIYVGKSVTFKAKKVEPKGSNDIIIWSTSNASVATVTPDGVVKGVGQGNAVITAESFGGKVLYEIPVKVMTKATSVSVNKTTASVAVNGTDTIEVTEIVPTGCNDTLTWSTSNKSVVSVTPSSDGKSVTIKGLKKGSATVTVKTGSGKSKKIKVTVTV